jgi:hypothetical protein
MNACQLLRSIAMGLALIPALTFAQQENITPVAYRYEAPGQDFSSNVPLNELNIHAYKHFHRIFSSGVTAEYWVKTADGYQASFMQNDRQHKAYFDRHGYFKYSLSYYEGKDIPRLAGELIHLRYPDYRINVVTEIYDGERTSYLVRVVNATNIKTLAVCDGQVEVMEEMVNGGR